MSYEVKFNGVNVHDYCSVLGIKRELLPTRSNSFLEIPNMNGSYYTGYRYGERIIELEIAIVSTDKQDYMQKVRKLAEIFAVKKPCKLILGDEPNIYYYAVPNDSTTLEKSFRTAKTSIILFCNDPIGYSRNTRCYETVHPNGTIELENKGTTVAYPLIDVDFTQDACFYQVTNPLGQTVLIGAPSYLLGSTIKEKVNSINNNCNDSSDFKPLAQSLLDDGRKVGGNFGVGNNGDRIICTNYGDGSDNSWSGTAFKLDLNEEFKDFEVTVDCSFASYDYPYLGNGSGSGSLGAYRVVNCSGLHINKQPKVGSPIHTMTAGTVIYPKEIKNGWAKHTTNGYTGYSSMQYLEKYNGGSSKAKATDERITPYVDVDDDETTYYVENEIGLMEIYGYDKNGVQLFKFEFVDQTKFFEYVEPKLYVGGNLLIEDGKVCPAPKTNYIENDYNSQGEKTYSETKVVSGIFGDYNDFEGNVKIRRQTDSKGNQIWSASINKIYSGKLVCCMTANNKIASSKYPKGELSYLGFYIGKYGTAMKPVNTMSINNIKVDRLNIKADQVVKENLQIFQKGDHLQINFQTGEILLNDTPFMEKLDIGSNFFDVPVGKSEIRCVSDGTQLSICGIQDRFM